MTYLPPIGPRDPSAHASPTWRVVLLSYVAIGAVPAALLAVSRPLVAVGLLAAIVSLVLVARRALALGRCYLGCGGFAVDLGDRIRVCITRPRTECPA